MKSKFKLLAMALIAGGTMFAQTRVSVGIGVGGYGPGVYPPPAYAQYQPPCPGPGYTWVDGYWAPQGGRNMWIAGFWRPPVVTVAPRYVAPHYYKAFRGHDRDDHFRQGFRR
jgi:WXXGXW repeat (2 copies)